MYSVLSEIYAVCNNNVVSRRGRRMNSGPTLLPVDSHVTDEANPCSKLSAAVVACEGSCIWGLYCRDRLTCRTFLSVALAVRASTKCCTSVEQTFRHLDLLPATSYQVMGSMPVDSRLTMTTILPHISRHTGMSLCLSAHYWDIDGSICLFYRRFVMRCKIVPYRNSLT